MSKLVVGIGCTVVAVTGIAALLQHQSNLQLRREVALLRDEVRRSVARDGSASPARHHSSDTLVAALPPAPTTSGSEELSGLREEIAALRKSTQDLTRLASAASLKQSLEAESAAPVNLTSVNELKNAGKATPQAAAETLFWAAVGGDIDVLANSLAFTPAARAKADAWFATLSANTRQQYGSPEKVVALMIAKDAAGLSGVQVLGQRELSADAIGVRMRFAAADGKTKDDNFMMQRSADGWRLMFPETALQKYAQKVAGK